jgi:hypothetical protein
MIPEGPRYFGRGDFNVASGVRSVPARASLTASATARARDIAHLFLHAFVAVERFVACCVRLVVADETTEPRLWSGVDQAHRVEPVRQRAPYPFDAGDVAVYDDAINEPHKRLAAL